MRAPLQGRTHHCNSLHNCPGSHRTIRQDSFLLHIHHGSRAQGHQAQLTPASAHLESRHHSSKHSSPACRRGLPHIVHWRPNFRNSDSHRCTEAAQVPGSVESRHRSSKHNSPACRRGLPHIVHWRPKFRNSDSHRCTESVAQVPGSVAQVPGSVESRHRSSNDSFPACKRGLPHIVHWRPNFRSSDYHRSTALATASVVAVATARSHHNSESSRCS